MPQNSSFHRLKLRKTAFGEGVEARYRAIRNYLHANRDREQEGVFYQHEKRAKRKGSPLNTSRLARSVSACYDWLAGYGQSYERALAWLIGVQVVVATAFEQGPACKIVASTNGDQWIKNVPMPQIMPFPIPGMPGPPMPPFSAPVPAPTPKP